ncbi:sigma-70 family RNA polymerase sigma factor [Paenibacillus sp. GCM10028914]|uniref:sigma-70 family RNA polymerase sigma factor n=1 Tax=Paenibacillus sp. GCM10028914 TaxID=3273416 RepID=UPI0036090C71
MKSNERNFIRRLKRQEEEALEYVVDNYLSLVKGVVYKVLSPLKQDHLIEECMNDVFLSVWDHAEQFKGDSSDFRKWICAVSKFKAIDYYRKAVKNMEISSEHTDTLTEESAEDAFIQIENSKELLQLIYGLDEMDREIFMMKFYLGVGTEDIASRFGLTRAAVDNRIYRGKKKLQQQAIQLSLGGSLI